jgi:hypothetical protein
MQARNIEISVICGRSSKIFLNPNSQKNKHITGKTIADIMQIEIINIIRKIANFTLILFLIYYFIFRLLKNKYQVFKKRL